MIHNVELPKATREQLMEVVKLQFALLRYAVDRDVIDEVTCATYLENTSRYSNERAGRIAHWLFNSKKRWEPLAEFAQGTEGNEALPDPKLDNLRKEKQELVEEMDVDSLDLRIGYGKVSLDVYMLKNELPSWLKAANYCLNEYKKMPDWLQGAKDFLINFYEALAKGLSGDIFTDGQKYTRQDFFAAFTAENPDLYVCAVCDETSFRTISGDHYSSDIEHYFPKSIYPHLACHPYNLIPICTYCNRFIHGDKDPLRATDGSRRNLGDIFLPYRQDSLAPQTALKLVWNLKDFEPTEITLVKRDANADLRDKIIAFGEVYNIPQRWQGKIHEIGEHLWRRIRHFLADELSVTDTLDSAEFVQQKLGRLLAYLWNDLGKDPLSFPSLWWLATLLANEVDPIVENRGTLSQSAFLLDIQRWTQHDPSQLDALDQTAAELRQVVKDIRP